MEASHLISSFVTFLLSAATLTSATANPPGFLSLSCGAPSPFTDSSNISWVPDTPYIAAGSTTFTTSLTPLRFFPSPEPDTRFCYRLSVADLSLVLVRAYFLYGDYDGLDRPPSFTVSLGTAAAALVNLTQSDPSTEEFVWKVENATLPFCLHSISNGGTPVISSLEVRPLPEDAYKTTSQNFVSALLRKRFRINCGYVGSTPIRYPFDPYDRVWASDQNFSPSHLSAGFGRSVPLNLSSLATNPPVSVLETARVLVRKDVMAYEFSLDKLGDYHVILYFAGIMPVLPSFDVLINGNMVSSGYTVKHGEASSIFFSGKSIDGLNITFQNISFYPQVNAIEIYEVVEIPLKCSTTTVSALQVIQQSSGFDLGWEDDPCSPTPWKHVGCSVNLVTSLDLPNMDLREIIPTFGDLIDLKTLDLHNTSLSGTIMNLGSLQQLENLNLSFNKLTSFGTDLDTMTNLRVLDLQNNSLEGKVPDSLASLKDLHLLNLENNKLRGPLPQSLHKGGLDVRTSGNLCLSFSLSTCNDADLPSIETPQFTVVNMKRPSGHKHRAILAAAVGVACCALLVIAIIIFVQLKRRKRDDKTSQTSREVGGWNATRVFTYKEIKTATNNFKNVIGSGGFGYVYHGKLSDGKLVAVKVQSDRTKLGAESFINEVHLLSQIRHQNLVLLEGFCYESKHQILVYEYLPGGSLADNLYGSNSKKATLNWAHRLKIAVDAAKGLDYLHNGNDPRIIHRDVKCSNILLDLDMNAKLGDFGLSKQLHQQDATHVATPIKGTAGYLDPEYYATQQLTEKSDIYSFGVVLLELICGRQPLSHVSTPDSFNLVLWAKPYLQADAFEIVDESLKGGFGVESMRKAASVAVRCVDRDASERPTIAEVLAELKEAYSTQLTTLPSGGQLY